MLEQVKKALVESYAGAIAIGWLFSNGILHFAYMFSAPVADWFTRRSYRDLTQRNISTSINLQMALPELMRSIVILLLAYVLLRWLYFKPAVESVSGTREEKSQEISGA
jgi:hypothetical protein